MSFAYFKELSRIGFLPVMDPHQKGGMTRAVSYIGFEASVLRDLDGNVALLNNPAVDTTPVADSLVADSASSTPKFEIRRRLLVDGEPIESYTVKSPQFFMMGDNRDNSADSRYWGFVSLRNVRAKAFVIYFSFENEDQKFALGNPFTWWRIPFNIRWSRIGKVIPLI
jgi:signal peptidase I